MPSIGIHKSNIMITSLYLYIYIYALIYINIIFIFEIKFYNIYI